MGMTTWVQLLDTPSPTADGATLATSTTLTDVSPAPQLILPANYLYPGSVLRVTASGEYSTTLTPTLLLGVYFGGVAGTAICTTGALTTISGASHTTWRLQAEVVCRTAGSSGSLYGTGQAAGITAITAAALLPANTPAAVTVNTTAAQAVTLGAQWGTSSASNTLTLHEFLIEALN